MAATEQPFIWGCDNAVPAPALLDGSTVIVARYPVTNRLNVIEFGVFVQSSTASGTSFVLTLKGEPVAGGTPVTLSTMTGTTTITQGKRGRRICDVEVDPATYSALTLTVVGGTASSTGVVYAKCRNGGSFATETNTIDFTS